MRKLLAGSWRQGTFILSEKAERSTVLPEAYGSTLIKILKKKKTNLESVEQEAKTTRAPPTAEEGLSHPLTSLKEEAGLGDPRRGSIARRGSVRSSLW